MRRGPAALAARAAACALAVALPAGCGGSGGKSPLPSRGLEPELVFCRSDRDNPHRLSEIAQTTVQALAERRVTNRAGVETGVRVHPDGTTVVFCRERDHDDPTSRELFSVPVDGSAAERRLTANRDVDDAPCWSPDGAAIVFSSTRGGAGRRLWRMAADGSDPRIVHDDGTEQSDPDWVAAAPRIVYSAVDPALGRARLYTVDPDGRMAVPLTDGGTGSAATAVAGDHEPAYAPDGAAVVFSRVLDDDNRALMLVDVASGAVTALPTGRGEHRYPRWSPAGDVLFVARSLPERGLAGLRLWALGAGGGDARLVIADRRFDFPGFDPLPELGPRDPLTAAAPLDVAGAELQLAGKRSAGNQLALRARDGMPLGVATFTNGTLETAAINLRPRLDLPSPDDLRELRVEVTAAISRFGGDTELLVGMHNPTESRTDTIVDVVPADDGYHTYSFALQSLRYVNRAGEIGVQVIANFEAGPQAELFVDHVAIEVRAVAR